MVVGFNEKLKTGVEIATNRLRVCVAPFDSDPVTLKAKVPADASLVLVNVRVAFPVGDTVADENFVVTPPGAPVTDRLTIFEDDLVAAQLRVKVTPAPALKLALY